LLEKDIWTPEARGVSVINRLWTPSSRSAKERHPLIEMANPRRLRLKLVVPLCGWLAVLLEQLLVLLGGRICLFGCSKIPQLYEKVQACFVVATFEARISSKRIPASLPTILLAGPLSYRRGPLEDRVFPTRGESPYTRGVGEGYKVGC
jgi:hypothetical protein